MTNADRSTRLAALRRFAVAITVLNVLGHAFFGFEQSLAQPLIALITAYAMEWVLETLDAAAAGRPARYRGSFVTVVDFFLSAHITGLAVAMLLYANDRLLPIAFASAVAVGSKALLRVRVSGQSCHVFNPSNFGISATLVLFPWVGIAPPYQFTENLHGVGDWILPAIIVTLGTFLNGRFTRKLPLIAAWLSVFALQAAIRSMLFDVPFAGTILPVTGVAFLLFTFYMITDPATTPAKPLHQVVFGAAVALTYGLLTVAHIVFGLFFALSIVCALRALVLIAARTPTLEHAQVPRQGKAREVIPGLRPRRVPVAST